MPDELERERARAILDAAKRSLDVPQFVGGTVATSMSPLASDGFATVKLDGDAPGSAVVLPVLNGLSLKIGQRVVVAFGKSGAGFVVGATGPPASRIGRSTTDGSTSSWTFTVPQYWTHLGFRVTTTSTTAATNVVALRFNGDTGNNYFYSADFAKFGGAWSKFSSGATSAIQIGEAYADASRQMVTEGIVPLYAGATYHKTVKAHGAWISSLASAPVGLFAGVWENSAAITSITVLSGSGVAFASGGVIEVWGTDGFPTV